MINYIFSNMKLKKLDSIEIEVDNNGKINIVDEWIKKKLIRELKAIKTGLNKRYELSSFSDKKILYKIIDSIEELSSSIKKDNLNSEDMKKIDIVMKIIKSSTKKTTRVEKVIFEWHEKYMK